MKTRKRGKRKLPSRGFCGSHGGHKDRGWQGGWVYAEGAISGYQPWRGKGSLHPQGQSTSEATAGGGLGLCPPPALQRPLLLLIRPPQRPFVSGLRPLSRLSPDRGAAQAAAEPADPPAT